MWPTAGQTVTRKTGQSAQVLLQPEEEAGAYVRQRLAAIRHAGIIGGGANMSDDLESGNLDLKYELECGRACDRIAVKARCATVLSQR